MNQILTLNLYSMPMLAVCLTSLLVCWLSLSLEWKRLEERILVGVYRVGALVNAVWMGVFFATSNGWLGTLVATRLMVALLACSPIVVIGLMRFLDHKRPSSLTLGVWGFNILTLFVLAADRGVLISASETTVPHLTPMLLLLLALLLLGLAVMVQEILQSVPPRLTSARGTVASSVMLSLTTLLDALVAFMGWPWPPMSWVGSLAVTMNFSNAITRHYRDAHRSLETIERERDRLQEARNTLEFQVAHDHLTGLYTRARAMQLLDQALERNGVCVVFLDLDDFKTWNDTFGHAMGDAVLRETAQAIRASIRQGDIAARYAGDEFFVVLPGSRVDAGLRVAEAIRQKLGEVRLDEQIPRITASFGVALGDQREQAALVVDRADRAVYQAKGSGKNRISSQDTTTRSGKRPMGKPSDRP